jgi:hypothetical protein
MWVIMVHFPNNYDSYSQSEQERPGRDEVQPNAGQLALFLRVLDHTERPAGLESLATFLGRSHINIWRHICHQKLNIWLIRILLRSRWTGPQRHTSHRHLRPPPPHHHLIIPLPSALPLVAATLRLLSFASPRNVLEHLACIIRASMAPASRR